MRTSDAEVAVEAVEAGAAVARAAYYAPLARYDKSATDFATDADIAAEEAILAVLRDQRPADAYHGEELGASGDATAGRVWLIDPICGTLNFAAQTPLAAVNVALREGAGVEVAAVADPLAGEVFWTDGRAAYLRGGGTESALAPSAATRLVDVNLDTAPVAAGAFDPARLLAEPAFRSAFGARVLSTTLALAWVAAGRRAAYVTAGDLRDSVHFAAGIALCRAAGCVVTGLRGEPLHTGGGGLVAAADQATHAALLAVVARQLTG